MAVNAITNYQLPITKPDLPIQVTLVGEPLARYLADERKAKVTARFDSSIQLESADEIFWAITTHPNAGAMRMVAPALPSWCEGAIVRVSDRKILAEGVELDWGMSVLFDPQPHQRALNVDERRRSAHNIAGVLTRWSLPDACGFWEEMGNLWEPLACVIASEAKQSPNNSRDCLADGYGDDMGRFDAIVSRLIGCGPGLTPAGGDFLQALLVTLHSGDDTDRAAFDSLASAVRPSLSRTTRTSQAFLREALEGWAFGALKQVLDALPEVTQDSINALLRIGATSGPAYAFGVLMGLSWKV